MIPQYIKELEDKYPEHWGVRVTLREGCEDHWPEPMLQSEALIMVANQIILQFDGEVINPVTKERFVTMVLAEMQKGISYRAIEGNKLADYIPDAVRNLFDAMTSKNMTETERVLLAAWIRRKDEDSL